MFEKSASVVWQGPGRTGKGTVSTETGALANMPYSFDSRLGEDAPGTNPEELLGAAHAACFTMAFAFAAERAGFAVGNANTQARVRLGKDGEGFAIDRVVLRLDAKVPGLDETRFQALAASAKNTCPLSKALAGVREVVLEARLLA